MDTSIDMERRAAEAATAVERLQRALNITADPGCTPETLAYVRRVMYAAAIIEDEYLPGLNASTEPAQHLMGVLQHRTMSTAELHG